MNDNEPAGYLRRCIEADKAGLTYALRILVQACHQGDLA